MWLPVEYNPQTKTITIERSHNEGKHQTEKKARRGFE